VHFVRDTFGCGKDPPDKSKAALGRGDPSAACNTEQLPKAFDCKDKPSHAAMQACRAMLRQDIGAALYLAQGNAALALRYLASGDDVAAAYLTNRVRLYAQYAAELAADLRRVAA
jgi:hypothetical protein